MDIEAETVHLEGEDSFHVYADNCLICNQQCYLKPTSPSCQDALPEGEKERIMEIRAVLYQAFEIPVERSFLEENKGELPLCPKCTFKMGQLRHVHYQLATLQREYNRIRQEIAFSIVDLVAGSDQGNKSYLADIGSKSPNAFLQCIKESEVDTIQHLVFENWHEMCSEDEPAISGEVQFSLPILKSDKQPVPRKQPPESSPALTITRTESYPMTKVKANVNSLVASTSSAPDVPSISSSVKRDSNTKLITITTSSSKDKVASVKVEEDEVEKLNSLNELLGKDEYDDEGIEQIVDNDSNMVIAMSPTQFCANSDCSSPDPGALLKIESDNELNEDDDDDDDPPQPFQIRQLAKGKPNALKFPNDLEITEWSSDESQPRGLDYDLYDQDEDASEDLEGLLDGSAKRLRVSRETDSSVESNALGGLEYQQNEEGLYVCMFCSKTFIHKYPYRDHLKTHTGEGPRCPLCNKIFPKNHNLMLHMRTHTGEKPYKCLVCGKGFADKSNLKVHMRVHTGERPYKCEFCDQAFVNSSRLVVHRRLHTGEKPFVCELCNRCFSTSNQMQTHRRIHIGDKGFKCDECGKSYTSTTTLQAHVNLAH